jgi:hypothetical protein
MEIDWFNALMGIWLIYSGFSYKKQQNDESS